MILKQLHESTIRMKVLVRHTVKTDEMVND
jgi:hypothetical protein